MAAFVVSPSVIGAVQAGPVVEPATEPGGARLISVDVGKVRGPRSMTYRQCVGAGRVGEGLRADWQAQLKLCHDEIGFESLRCHGLFHDELGVYTEDASGKPIYNFQYIDSVYDYLLSIGVRPFVELGFMPNALASISSDKADADGMMTDPNNPKTKRRVTVFYWRSNVTPPKDVAKWAGLVKATVQHWTDRYGADEVKHWHFEVWNEPNHVAFWSPTSAPHREEEYLSLYAATAKAVCSVNSAYQVGGPATAGPAYIADLIADATKNDLPLDFITFHAYGLTGGPGGLDEFGRRRLYLNPDVLSPARSAKSQNGVIARSSKPSLPVNITEWSTSYSARDAVHDDYFSAPYVLAQLKNTQSLASMSYWTFTDIFEETGVPPNPFHGGFGLINLQGICKPSYFAYKFLNQLGKDELIDSDSDSWATINPDGAVQALFWNLTFPKSNPKEDNNHFFAQVRPPAPVEPVRLVVKGLKPGKYVATVYRIGFENNDAYTAYLKLGAPSNLSLQQVQTLKGVAAGKPVSQATIEVSADHAWTQDFPMHQNDVVFATVKPLLER